MLTRKHAKKRLEGKLQTISKQAPYIISCMHLRRIITPHYARQRYWLPHTSPQSIPVYTSKYIEESIYMESIYIYICKPNNTGKKKQKRNNTWQGLLYPLPGMYVSTTCEDGEKYEKINVRQKQACLQGADRESRGMKAAAAHWCVGLISPMSSWTRWWTSRRTTTLQNP